MQLELYEEALQDAERARQLAEAALNTDKRSGAGFVKAFLRKGAALIGTTPTYATHALDCCKPYYSWLDAVDFKSKISLKHSILLRSPAHLILLQGLSGTEKLPKCWRRG